MTQTPSNPVSPNNTLRSFRNKRATAEAARRQGTREIWIGEFDANGDLDLSTCVLLQTLRQGDTGPRAEPTTEDVTYDNGQVVQSLTGENIPAVTWELDSSIDEPDAALLRKYHFKYGPPEARGKSLGYLAYNLDRSFFQGPFKVTGAGAPRDAGHRWAFNINFLDAELGDPDDNPIPYLGDVPTFTAPLAPATGPVGTDVTANGTQLDDVTAVRFGAVSIPASAFISQIATRIVFDVPAGQTAGAKDVFLVYGGGEVAAGQFTVS